jgi:hypothetical protein
MSIDPSFEEQELLADTFAREGSRMDKRGLFFATIASAAFAAAVAALWLLRPLHSFEIAPALISLVVLVLATLVRFDTPFGGARATQLGLVPLLFAVPLEARIISCDTWNAMRSDRPYRKALSYDVAVAELASNAGGQFDPRVVETFVRLVAPADQADALQASAAVAVRAPAPLIAGSAKV